jgi:hypothetical protein
MKLIRAVLAVLLEELTQSESFQLHVASSCRLTPPVKLVHLKKLIAQTVQSCS